MAIFYTTHEGGKIQKFPKSIAHWWAMEELCRNITTSEYRVEEAPDLLLLFSPDQFPVSMKCSYLCGIRVDSVFFTKGDELYQIFDVKRKETGYRRVRIGKIPYGPAQFRPFFKDFIKNKQWLNSNQ